MLPILETRPGMEFRLHGEDAIRFAWGGDLRFSGFLASNGPGNLTAYEAALIVPCVIKDVISRDAPTYPEAMNGVSLAEPHQDLMPVDKRSLSSPTAANRTLTAADS